MDPNPKFFERPPGVPFQKIQFGMPARGAFCSFKTPGPCPKKILHSLEQKSRGLFLADCSKFNSCSLENPKASRNSKLDCQVLESQVGIPSRNLCEYFSLGVLLSNRGSRSDRALWRKRLQSNAALPARNQHSQNSSKRRREEPRNARGLVARETSNVM